jgi:hypothetical protein
VFLRSNFRKLNSRSDERRVTLPLNPSRLSSNQTVVDYGNELKQYIMYHLYKESVAKHVDLHLHFACLYWGTKRRADHKRTTSNSQHPKKPRVFDSRNPRHQPGTTKIMLVNPPVRMQKTPGKLRKSKFDSPKALKAPAKAQSLKTQGKIGHGQAQALKTQLPTEVQSLNLMRNLVGTTIGAVTYLRGLFDEDVYQDHSVGGLALKGLARNINPEADALIDLLEKGVYDALEKKYLRTLMFGIYLEEDKPDDLVETWTFNFRYPASKPHLDIEIKSKKQTITHQVNPEEFTKEIIRATTVQMLRSLLYVVFPSN